MSVIGGLVEWISRGPTRTLDHVRALLEPLRSQSLAADTQFGVFGKCALGVSRLPMAPPGRRIGGLCERGPIAVVVDGQLDRTADLCSLLRLDVKASDPEIVAAAYEKFGTACFARLCGDFAIAIWDTRSEALIAARDTFSVRPLHYAAPDGAFIVASDPEQMLAAGLVSRDVDDDSVIDYLLRKPRFVDRTFFREIRALPGGHVLVADRQGHKISAFVPTALSKVRLSSREDYWDEYRRRFRSAVASRLESDGPVVAELSGGVDSSAIVCIADRLLRESSVRCASLTAAAGLYPGLECDEEPFIRAVEKSVRIPVQYWNATEGASDELERSSIAVPGGRFATFAGTDGQFDIARARGARILISGFGGDQVGAPSGGVRDAVTEFRWMDAVRLVVGRPNVDARKIAGTLSALARSFTPRSVRRIRTSLAPDHPTAPWLSESARRRSRSAPDVTPWVDLESEIQRRIWRSITAGGHSMAMLYTQHHAIRSGVDSRFPFLDLDLVSIVLSIPSRYWPPPWLFERLHREILRDDLPAEVARRRSKAEFSSAVALRVSRHLSSVRDLFLSSEWRAERYVDQAEARTLLADFMSTKRPLIAVSYGVWAVAALEAWLRAVSGYPNRRKWEAPPNV